MRRIGVTGGIGAGKSAVASYLRGKGYAVFDADEVARELTEAGAPLLERIREEFGDGVFSVDGALDRKAMASFVFSDAEKLARLNEMLHPEVFKRMDELAERVSAETHAVFFVVPLLFETGAEKRYDEVWLVSAGEDTRIARASARDGADESEIRARMKAQLSEAERRKRADEIIENAGSLEELHEKIDALLVKL